MLARPASTLLATLALVLLAGCTRPTVRVCRGVTDAGVCSQPPTTLLVGKPYVVHVTGHGMPTGRVTVALERWEGRRRVPVATATREVPADASYFTNPLMIPRRGSYRVSVRDAHGDEFQHVDVRAPEAAVTVVPPR